MSSVLIHSFRRCPFAIRVRMVLEEKGIFYHVREEKLSEPSSELLELHPEGRVPVLVHENEGNKRVLTESRIITEYLDEVFPGPKLMPNDPFEKAQVRLWTHWCDAIFKPDLDLFKYEQPNLTPEAFQELVDRLHSHLKYWNQALSRRPYLLGEVLTLADIHLFPFARQFMAIRPSFPDVEQYSDLTRWLNQILERPSFIRVMKR